MSAILAYCSLQASASIATVNSTDTRGQRKHMFNSFFTQQYKQKIEIQDVVTE